MAIRLHQRPAHLERELFVSGTKECLPSTALMRLHADSAHALHLTDEEINAKLMSSSWTLQIIWQVETTVGAICKMQMRFCTFV